MANETHIIVKNPGRWGTKQFFNPVDKGSAKPAFCYPKRAQNLREELKSMERTLDSGLIDPSRRMAYEQKKNILAKRVSEIDASFDNAREIIEKSKDGWKTRRDNLAKKIEQSSPSKQDVRTRRVNPHTVLKQEKEGLKGERPLEQDKRDYTIISRAFQAAGEYEEANHSFLQKDK